jgi:hypothetical protein
VDRGKLQMGMLAIDIASLHEKLPYPGRDFWECKRDGLVVRIKHKKQREISSLLTDARWLSPPIKRKRDFPRTLTPAVLTDGLFSIWLVRQWRLCGS